MRVQARYVLRLGAYLQETGTRQSWLAEQIGVKRPTLHAWLTGDAPLPRHRRAQILEVLRQRQDLPVGSDLFERTED